MKYLLVLTSFFVWATAALGQDECECPVTEGFEADFCYTSTTITGKCAQFSVKADYFFFHPKTEKKGKKLSLTSQPAKEQLIAWAENKKNKLNALDILFLQEALMAWKKKVVVDQVKVGQAIASKKLYTAEELAAIEFEQQDTGLGIHILQQGMGPMPEKGVQVKVQYRGYLTNGTVFDASYNRGQPFQFKLGVGQVIKGWDIGILQLPVGSRALIKLPPEIAYGSRDMGTIPANSTLIFDVLVMSTD